MSRQIMIDMQKQLEMLQQQMSLMQENHVIRDFEELDDDRLILKFSDEEGIIVPLRIKEIENWLTLPANEHGMIEVNLKDFSNTFKKGDNWVES